MARVEGHPVSQSSRGEDSRVAWKWGQDRIGVNMLKVNFFLRVYNSDFDENRNTTNHYKITIYVAAHC